MTGPYDHFDPEDAAADWLVDVALGDRDDEDWPEPDNEYPDDEC